MTHLSGTRQRLRARSSHAAAALIAACSLLLAACGEGDEGQVASNSQADQQTPATGPAADRPRPAEKTTTTAAAAAVTVAVADDVFEPAEVEVTTGEAVAWKWEGENPHNVSGSGFKSKIQTSGTFTKAFAKAGTFDFRCEVHPNMKGTVVVTG